MTIERAGADDLAMGALSTHGRVPQQFGVVLLLEPAGTPRRCGGSRPIGSAACRGSGSGSSRCRPWPGGRSGWTTPRSRPGRTSTGGPVRRRGTSGRSWTSPPTSPVPGWIRRARCGRRPWWRGWPAAASPSSCCWTTWSPTASGGWPCSPGSPTPGPPGNVRPLPRPRPSYRALVADATRAKVAALRRVPGIVRALRSSLRSGGGAHPPRAAACSLLSATGDGRRFGLATAELAALHAAAADVGATVNDALLVAVSMALSDLLAARGESVPEFRVGIVVAGRWSADVAHLGNATSPLLLTVPGVGPAGERLRRIAGVVRRERDEATATAAVAVVGPLIRLAATTGLYGRWLRSQQRLHTLVSNVPGITRAADPGRPGGEPSRAHRRRRQRERDRLLRVPVLRGDARRHRGGRSRPRAGPAAPDRRAAARRSTGWGLPALRVPTHGPGRWTRSAPSVPP